MNSSNSVLEDIESGMTRVEEIIETMSSEPENYPSVLALHKTVERIGDLGMIHGFEGVQNISEKLLISIRDSIDASTGPSAALLTKVRQAMAAMRDVANLECNIEQHLTVESVTERAELDRIKVFDRTQEFSRTVALCPEEPQSVEIADAEQVATVQIVEPEAQAPRVSIVEQDDPEPEFDITEVHSVMNLIEDPAVLGPEHAAAAFDSEDSDHTSSSK